MITMSYRRLCESPYKFISLRLKSCCAALSFLILGSTAQETWANAINDGTLRMQTATMTRQTMPDSCDSPYKDVSGFSVFFDSVIFVMASEKGPSETGVGDLFAVSELQKKMTEIFPNIGEESPIDRLVIAQLCQYRQIFKGKNNLNDASVSITSEDPQLQKHLQRIGSQLFIDARGLMVSALSAHARTQSRREQIKLTVDRVDRARDLGRNKIEGLFRSFQ